MCSPGSTLPIPAPTGRTVTVVNLEAFDPEAYPDPTDQPGTLYVKLSRE